MMVVMVVVVVVLDMVIVAFVYMCEWGMGVGAWGRMHSTLHTVPPSAGPS
jgi:hypothetical protein